MTLISPNFNVFGSEDGEIDAVTTVINCSSAAVVVQGINWEDNVLLLKFSADSDKIGVGVSCGHRRDDFNWSLVVFLVVILVFGFWLTSLNEK